MLCHVQCHVLCHEQAMGCAQAGARFPALFRSHVSLPFLVLFLMVAAAGTALGLRKYVAKAKDRYSNVDVVDRFVKTLNTIIFLIHPGSPF